MIIVILSLILCVFLYFIARTIEDEAKRKAEFHYIDTCYKLADLTIKEDKIRDPKKILAIYEQVEKDIDAYRAKHK